MKQNDLDRVQRWMHAVITHPDGIVAGADADKARELLDAGAGNLEAIVTRSTHLTGAERLAIYGNAYYSRLIDCTGEVFPVLKRTLGEEVFNGFVFGYLQNYPSTSYTLHHLGRNFVGYLCETRPEDAQWSDFLIDLARLEWEIYDVFDGPGLEEKESFEFESLLEIDPARWLNLRFKTAPCLRLLTTKYPVNNHYTLVRGTDEAIEIPFPGPDPENIAVSRRDYVVRRYHLSLPQYVLLTELQKGEPLGIALESCADAAQNDPSINLEHDLTSWFSYWSSEQSFFENISGESESQFS